MGHYAAAARKVAQMQIAVTQAKSQLNALVRRA